jgi:hypothetical protein
MAEVRSETCLAVLLHEVGIAVSLFMLAAAARVCDQWHAHKLCSAAYGSRLDIASGV